MVEFKKHWPYAETTICVESGRADRYVPSRDDGPDAAPRPTIISWCANVDIWGCGITADYTDDFGVYSRERCLKIVKLGRKFMFGGTNG